MRTFPLTWRLVLKLVAHLDVGLTGQEYLVRVTYENALGAGEPSDVLRVLVR